MATKRRTVEPLAVSVSTAAQKLEVSEMHIRRLIKEGSIRTTLVGEAIRIPMSEVNRLAGVEALPA